MSFPPYQAYKNLPLAWLEKIPEQWEIKALKHCICRLGSGGTPESSNPDYWTDEGSEEGIHWVAIGDMTINPVITNTQKRVTKAGLKSKGLEIFPSGTLLYSIYASLGKVATLGIDATFNQAILAIKPDESTIRQTFLCYWLQSLEPHLSYYSSSNTQSNLNAGKVLSFPVALPSLDEQLAIARFLEHEITKIDSLIAKQERLIELLQEKRQAVIFHSVTKGQNPNAPMKDSGVEWLGELPAHWEVKPLKRVGRLIAGFAFKSADFAMEGVRVLKIANIQTRFLDLEDEAYVNEQIAKKAADYTIKTGDLLFALTRPIISSGIKVAISDKEGMLLNQRNAIFRLKGKYKDSSFIYHLVFAKNFETEFNSWIDRTGQQPNISTTSIGNISIPIPPAKEMEAIGEYLDSQEIEFESIISNARKMMTLLAEKRAALISAAVTGQIDVRGLIPEEEAA